MDTVFGIKGKDFALLAADSSASRSIVRFSDSEDKILSVDSHAMMGIAGPVADRENFGEFIQRNVAFYSFKNGVKLSTEALANYTRGKLAEALRKGPFQTNIVLAGHDQEGPSIFFMDYLASLHKVNTAAQGYGAYFLYGLLDRTYKENMSVEEAVAIAKSCIQELQARFVMGLPKFSVKIVDAQGIRSIDLNDF